MIVHKTSNEINTYINQLIDFENAKSFDSIDEIHQDKFIALCLKSMDCDTDITLNLEANRSLMKYLLSYDRDEEINLVKEIKESVKDQFSGYFNELIENERRDRYLESMYENNKIQIVDRINGEARWV